jgi:NAD(P)H-dependent flavin oxidoreductase YrpB (nitropropane dioxygenase family)
MDILAFIGVRRYYKGLWLGWNMIRTSICDLLGIELPIIQAPISNATCPELAAAVSNSCGLGMLSVTWRQPDEIRAVIRKTHSLTHQPFGINLVLETDVHDRLNICLEEGVKVISLFWGAPHSYVRAAHQAGALVMHSVGSVSEAQEAVSAGADVIVAQGWEAGGHVRGTVSTLALVPAVVDAVAPIPVVASGGIADGRGIAAVLALGASAAMLGTRFVASEEAMSHYTYKQKLLAAGVGDTVYSTLFDVGWENAAHRALRNSTVEMWEKAGRPPRGERPNEGEVIARKADGTPVVRYSFSQPLETMQGDVEGMVHYAGQSVGLIRDIYPAARIVQRLKQETEQVMEQWQ